MDPQVTWDQLLRAFAGEDWPTVQEYAEALRAWLAHGGFPPKVIVDPQIGDSFNSALADAACDFALVQAAQKEWPA